MERALLTVRVHLASELRGQGVFKVPWEPGEAEGRPVEAGGDSLHLLTHR